MRDTVCSHFAQLKNVNFSIFFKLCNCILYNAKEPIIFRLKCIVLKCKQIDRWNVISLRTFIQLSMRIGYRMSMSISISMSNKQTGNHTIAQSFGSIVECSILIIEGQSINYLMKSGYWKSDQIDCSRWSSINDTNHSIFFRNIALTALGIRQWCKREII